MDIYWWWLYEHVMPPFTNIMAFDYVIQAYGDFVYASEDCTQQIDAIFCVWTTTISLHCK